MFKKHYLLVLLLCYFMQGGAQALTDVRIKVDETSHNYDCGTDEGGFFGLGDPEPRWRIRARYRNSLIATTPPGFGSQQVLNPGSQPCGIEIWNRLINNFNQICADFIDVEIDSWEDDKVLGVGDENIFDLTDDNHDVTTFSIPFKNATPGVDTVYILTQGNGYTTSLNVRWGISTAPVLSIATKDTVCVGDAATLTASHLTNNNGMFSWYGDSLLANHLFSGNPFITAPIIAASSFWVTESVIGGCVSAPVKTTVAIKNSPAAPSVNSPLICIGQSARLAATSPVTNSMFTWYADNQKRIILGSDSVYNTLPVNVSPTMYYVNVKDLSTGCTSPLTTSTITLNPKPITPIVSSNGPLCEGDTLKLNTTATGVGYTWTGPNGFVSASQNPRINNVTEADHQGIYTLQTFSIANNCKSDPASILVDVNRVKNVLFAFSNTPVCNGDSIKLTTTAIAGATYNWTGPNGFVSTLREPSIKADPKYTGLYKVRAKIGNCYTDYVETLVNVLARPTVNIGPDDTLASDMGYVVHAIGDGMVKWTPENLVEVSNAQSTKVKLPAGNNTLYCTITNAAGCAATDTLNLFVTISSDMKAMNLITPNGDGMNDKFEIPNLSKLPNNQLLIYDRGGVELFNVMNYNNDWNGTWEGKDLPDGTYWWVLKSGTQFYRGALNIKR